MTAIGTLNPKLNSAKREGWSEWIRCDHDERAVMAGCRFDPVYAQHVRDFFTKYLRHSKGMWAGKPFELEEWQWSGLIAPIFGWLREDGSRRIRRAYCEVPKKNGKSTLGAGVGLYLLVGDGEQGAEVYSAATKKDQAGIVHDEAIRMVKASDMLIKRLRINHSSKVITFEQTQSRYAALAADAKGSEGWNIHGIIKDELHAWTDRPFLDSLRYGGAVRRQPLDFTITTAGVFDRSSIGWSEHEYAQRWVDDGVEDDEYWAFISCASKEDDIEDPGAHKRANPSYGTIIRPQEIAKAAKEAVDRPVERFSFMRYRLNLWTEAAFSWLDMASWDACSGKVDEEALDGRICYAGLDLASKRDMASFILLFPPEEDGGAWEILCRYWCPQKGAIDRSRTENVKYMTWAEAGYLRLTPGHEMGYRVIADDILRDMERFEVRSLAFDPWNADTVLTSIRDVYGEDCETLVQFQQNMRNFTEPIKKLEAMVLEGSVAHGGHPVMRWNVANVKVICNTNENVKFDKKSSKDKIDGAVCLAMALGRAMVDEPDASYEKRGLFRL